MLVADSKHSEKMQINCWIQALGILSLQRVMFYFLVPITLKLWLFSINANIMKIGVAVLIVIMCCVAVWGVCVCDGVASRSMYKCTYTIY